MSYIVTRSFYEGDTLHLEGSEFQHEDKAYTEKCLADGNIASAEPKVQEAAQPTAPLEPQPAASVSAAPAAPQSPVQPPAPQVPAPPTPPATTPSSPTAAQIEQDLASTGL